MWAAQWVTLPWPEAVPIQLLSRFLCWTHFFQDINTVSYSTKEEAVLLEGRRFPLNRKWNMSSNQSPCNRTTREPLHLESEVCFLSAFSCNESHSCRKLYLPLSHSHSIVSPGTNLRQTPEPAGVTWSWRDGPALSADTIRHHRTSFIHEETIPGRKKPNAAEPPQQDKVTWKPAHIDVNLKRSKHSKQKEQLHCQTNALHQVHHSTHLNEMLWSRNIQNASKYTKGFLNMFYEDPDETCRSDSKLLYTKCCWSFDLCTLFPSPCTLEISEVNDINLSNWLQ